MKSWVAMALATLVIACGEPPVITASEFTELRDGMSYAEAQKVIGAPGEVISSSNLGGISTQMYMWKNSNGGNANAMFQNDKLITKAQMGLK